MNSPSLPPSGYFTDHLKQSDPAVDAAVAGELTRQQKGIELIASENIVSRASLAARQAPLELKIHAKVVALCERFPIYIDDP